jgi:hypothetical protein
VERDPTPGTDWRYLPHEVALPLEHACVVAVEPPIMPLHTARPVRWMQRTFESMVSCRPASFWSFFVSLSAASFGAAGGNVG